MNYDPSIHEILVLNPALGQVEKIYDSMLREDGMQDASKNFITEFFEIYEIDKSVETDWPEEEVTVGLTFREPIVLVKKVIPRPLYVLHPKIKKIKS